MLPLKWPSTPSKEVKLAARSLGSSKGSWEILARVYEEKEEIEEESPRFEEIIEISSSFSPSFSSGSIVCMGEFSPIISPPVKRANDSFDTIKCKKFKKH